MQVINDLREREQYSIWRRRNRVRLVDISRYCGCSISTISQWENSQINVNDKIIQAYDEFIKLFEQKRIHTYN